MTPQSQSQRQEQQQDANRRLTAVRSRDRLDRKPARLPPEASWRAHTNAALGRSSHQQPPRASARHAANFQRRLQSRIFGPCNCAQVKGGSGLHYHPDSLPAIQWQPCKCADPTSACAPDTPEQFTGTHRTEGDESKSPGGHIACQRHSDWEVEAPLQLRVRGAPSGKPDLQLQLFDLRWGAARRRRKSTCSRRGASVPARGPCRRDAARQTVNGLARRSAVLVFGSLLFPDTVSPVVAYMAVAGFVAASGTLVAALSAPAGKCGPGLRGQQSAEQRGGWQRALASGVLPVSHWCHSWALGFKLYYTA